MVMLLVKNSKSDFEIILGLYPFFLKQSVDIVLAMNDSMLTKPMQDWKTCWLSSLLIAKRSKWLVTDGFQ